MGKTLHIIALKQFGLSDGTPFKSGSGLVVIARTQEAFGWLAKDPRWEPLARSSTVRACNDLPKSNNTPIAYYGGGGLAGVVPGNGFNSHSHV